jgi:hypothetical protein
MEELWLPLSSHRSTSLSRTPTPPQCYAIAKIPYAMERIQSREWCFYYSLKV